MEATPPTATPIASPDGTAARDGGLGDSGHGENARAEKRHRKMNSVRDIAVAVLVAFALGAAVAFWFAYSKGWILPDATQSQDVVTAAALPDNALPGAATSTGSAIAAPAQAAIDIRLDELERRLNRIDLQAEAASGHAARAEGLLVAFAARRLLERGAPLGYLENQLQLRFGNAQPNAVRAIINGSRNPVTLDSLRTGLENISLTAVEEPETLSGWERLKSEIAGLFVLRSASAPSPQPEMRLDRARQLLDDGRVEAAAALVERLPNREGVEPWLADARRFVTVHDALDLIETAALLEPRQFNDGEGQPVRQRSPAAPAQTSPAQTSAAQTSTAAETAAAALN
ncbi:hypothetical protein EKN06_13345 [Croceicoccus ponticola]|uniref:Inner membrane protein n=1 Tax=Croceicoccus ponticola TaxID=2217664 RepID=A0A437GV59_9SPHN|nr:hypothetical protein [Croceicoccus ponticola]RVQ65512.1 hypothetical protein EKN06_13345 [Croceicoccus ponticola]